MTIPSPLIAIGARVSTDTWGAGEVIGRSFDNLEHEAQWKYRVYWDRGEVTNHHFDHDLHEIRTEHTRAESL